MALFLSKEQRRVKKEFRRLGVSVPDYMLTDQFLNLSWGANLQEVVFKLVQGNCKSKQFSFLMDISKDDFGAYYYLLDHLDLLTDSNMDIYEKDSNLFSRLVSLEKEGNLGSDFSSEVEKYGSDIIMNHPDFWQYSSKLSDEQIRLLKEKPGAYSFVMSFVKRPVLTSDSFLNSLSFSQLETVISSPQFQKISSIIEKNNSPLLIRSVLDYSYDEELVSFVEQLQNKYSNESKFFTASEIAHTVLMDEELSPLFTRKVSMLLGKESLRSADLSHLTPNQFNQDCVLTYFSVYCNSTDLGKLQAIFNEAKESSFLENSDVANMQIFLNLIGQLNTGVLVAEDFLKQVDSFAASIHYHIDFTSIRQWILDFKASQVNQDVVNSNLNASSMVNYTTEDSVSHSIPLITVDDPNYKALVHGIQQKNKLTSPNYEFGNQLFENPTLWERNQQGNPNISLSLLNKTGVTFVGGSGILLGFNGVSSNRLVQLGNKDLGTRMGDFTIPSFSSIQEVSIPSVESYQELLNIHSPSYHVSVSPQDYSEVVVRRWQEEQTVQPDYIMVNDYIMSDEELYQDSLKWADYFHIPLVKIDHEKIAQKHRSHYQEVMQQIQESKTLNKESIIDLFSTAYLYNGNVNYYLGNYENQIHTFDILSEVVKEKEINHENARVLKECFFSDIGDNTLNDNMDKFKSLASGYPYSLEKVEQRLHFVTSLYHQVEDALSLNHDLGITNPSELLDYDSPSESLRPITSAKDMLDDVSLSNSEVNSFTK